MFSSLKCLFFLKTLPKARRLTETRTDNKNEGCLTTSEQSNIKIHLPPKLKDTQSSDEEGPGQPFFRYVISIYISGMGTSPVLATRAAIISSTGNSQGGFCFLLLV